VVSPALSPTRAQSSVLGPGAAAWRRARADPG
jgi:hypothetical protein